MCGYMYVIHVKNIRTATVFLVCCVSIYISDTLDSWYIAQTIKSYTMPSAPVRNTNIKKASMLKHPVRLNSTSALASFRARVFPESKFSATER